MIAVDLFGNVAPVGEIEALGVPVLEDAAQAAGSTLHGRRAGSLGARGDAVRSSRPRTSARFGDGGAVATADAGSPRRRGCCASTARATRSTYEEVGYNSRLDELQAALLRVLLPELDGWAAAAAPPRATTSEAGLGELRRRCRSAVAGADPAWHLYVVRHPLAPTGWRTRWAAWASAPAATTATPVHRQPAMREYAPA